MTTSIYTNKYINFNNEKIFLGEGKNTQRYDVVKYEVFSDLTDNMMGKDWAHDEVQCTKDKLDYAKIGVAAKHAYDSVLQKLIFLDSMAGRGILTILGPIITLPEFEACVTEWQRFEINKHSRSYTHILRSVYDNPTALFDASFDIQELSGICDSINSQFDNAFRLVNKYVYNDQNAKTNSEADIFEMKKAIVRLLLEVNILEGIRFYSGFATIWSMHYSQGMMERTSKILQLICRDENIHLAITQNLLKILRTREDEGFIEAYAYWQPKIQDVYNEVLHQEYEWVDFLFSKGSFLGMTPDLMKQYLRYLTNRRLKAIGEEPLFPELRNNPLPWTVDYINMDSVETKPQEGEVINYRVDMLSKDVDERQLEELKEQL